MTLIAPAARGEVQRPASSFTLEHNRLETVHSLTSGRVYKASLGIETTCWNAGTYLKHPAGITGGQHEGNGQTVSLKVSGAWNSPHASKLALKLSNSPPAYASKFSATGGYNKISAREHA